ncbi:MAG: FHA domain-containing protein [Planctomycetaceae bacterium]|nr:FHA domain-containing protein [Planctomycetaceae bacterium]
MAKQQSLENHTLYGERACDDDEYFSTPAPGVCLTIYGGSNDRKSVEIKRCGTYLLGRSKDSDFRFSDYNRMDSRVSRRHAALHIDRQTVVLVNQAPRNGLMLNGVYLADHQEEPLNDTDVITLGDKGPNIRVRIGDLGSLEQEPPSHGA